MDFGDILLNFAAGGDDEARKAVENVEKAVDKLGESSEEAAARLAALGDRGSDSFKRIEAAAAKTAERVKEVTGSKGKGLTGTFIDDPTAPGGLRPADQEASTAATLKAAEAIRKYRADLNLLKKELPGVVAGEKAVADINQRLAASYEAVGTSSEQIAGRTQKATGFFGKLSGTIEGLDDKFNKVGLNFRGVSILLGAGLATGVAGAIRIVQKLGQALFELIAPEVELERQTNLTFGNAGDTIREFADGAAASFGLTRREALELANSFDPLLDKLNLVGGEGARFAQVFAEIAAVISRTQPGFKDLADIQSTIQQAIGGSDEAVLKLGLDLNAVAKLSLELFGKLPDSLTEYERSILVLRATSKTTADSIAKDGIKTRNIWEIATDGIRKGIDIIGTATQEMDRTILESMARRGQAIAPGILQRQSEDFLESLREEAAGHKDLVASIDAELERRKGRAKALEEEALSAAELVELQKLAEDAFLRSTSLQERAIDAQRTLNRAREDGARRVIEAEERVSRAFEDAARKREDLEIRNARTAEDAVTRLREAERQFTDAQIEGQRRREDAADRVVDARERGERDIRSAQERLEDLDLDHTRKVEDLQRRIREARRQTRDQSIEALIDLQQAIRRGTGLEINEAARRVAAAREAQGEAGALADAQRELQREQEDFVRDRVRAERELRESRLDAIKEIDRAVRDQQRAENDAARQIEKAQDDIVKARREQTRAIEDAERAVRALRIENVRAVEDAIKGVRDAERERDRAIAEASLGFQRLARDIDLTVEKLGELIERILTAQSFGPIVGPGGFFNIPGGQHGGLFHGPFWAGEGGMTELIVPRGGSNQVISHQQLVKLFREAFGSGGNGGGNNFTIYETASPEATAAAVEARLMRGMNN